MLEIKSYMYRGYTIARTLYGWAIYSPLGNYRAELATEQEAREMIDYWVNSAM